MDPEQIAALTKGITILALLGMAYLIFERPDLWKKIKKKLQAQ